MVCTSISPFIALWGFYGKLGWEVPEDLLAYQDELMDGGDLVCTPRHSTPLCNKLEPVLITNIMFYDNTID